MSELKTPSRPSLSPSNVVPTGSDVANVMQTASTGATSPTPEPPLQDTTPASAIPSQTGSTHPRLVGSGTKTTGVSVQKLQQKPTPSLHSTNTKLEPNPVIDNPAADSRNMRRIIAEDPEWSLATVPLLTDLVIKNIIKNFQDNSKVLNDLLPIHKSAVLSKLPTTLPLKVTAPLVDDEGYWKRCCKARWKLCNVSAYNNSWKQMYFERNLEHIIEHFVPSKTDPTELNETLLLSADFVKKLDIKQLLPPVNETRDYTNIVNLSESVSDTGEEVDTDHFNFKPVLEQLPFLRELCLTFGVRDCGMNFEWILFQFTSRDCYHLAQCIAKCHTLTRLQLHRSKVDDDKVRMLISQILDHPSLTELDLSHNVIDDRGARALGKFLNNHSLLTYLNVCNNQIHTKGAQAIAHAITKTKTLKKLNLRLNRLGDEGAQAICRSLLRNDTLLDINLSSNDMAEPSCLVLSQVLQQNNTLKRIDLSCNPIGQDGGKQLQEGMEENSSIVHMDLRLTECGQESEYCINQILEKNKELERVKKLTTTVEFTRASSIMTSRPSLIPQQA